MKKFITLILFLGINLFAQDNFYWRNAEASSSNWNLWSNWWNTRTLSAWVPGGAEILHFDNDSYAGAMTNNLPATNRHKLFFDVGASTSRTISGATENIFYEYSLVSPKIENNSSGNHTIAFPVKIGGVGDNPGYMELNPVNADLTFSNTFNNNGLNIVAFSNGSLTKSLNFSGGLSGSGMLTIKSGTLAKVSAASSITGDIAIDFGEFWIEQGGSLGGTGVIKVGGSTATNMSKLWISDADGGTTVSRDIVVSAGSVLKRYIGGLNTSGTNTFSGNINLSAQGSNGTNFEAINSSGTVEFSGIISGASSAVNKTGSGTVIFSGNNSYTGATTVKVGTLTVSSTGNAGSGTLTINGNTVFNSYNSLSNSTITVNGTFNVLADITVNNLVLNGSFNLNGHTLSIASGCALTVKTPVDMQSGSVILLGTATMISQTADVYPGFLYSSTNTGTVSRSVNSTPFTYYVGTEDGIYRNAVTITNSGTERVFTVSVSNMERNPSYNTNHIQCFWTITPNNQTNINCTLTLEWQLAQEQPNFDRTSNTLSIGRYSGTVWVPTLVTVAGSDPYTVTASGFTSFSEFGVGSNGALPVELTSFNASLRNGMINLNWETATEVDNNGFEVQRKDSKSEWTKIGYVDGHGTSNSPKYYNYSDKPLNSDKYSYRLKQIDNDGSHEFSPIVEVLVNNIPKGFVLDQNYPNPFNPETSIRFALKEDTKTTVKVYNSLGAEVATLFEGIAEAGRYYDVKFGGTDLASGLYFYKLVAGEFVSVKKMIFMK
jgi:autotransporter-associated beta strand protein